MGLVADSLEIKYAFFHDWAYLAITIMIWLCYWLVKATTKKKNCIETNKILEPRFRGDFSYKRYYRDHTPHIIVSFLLTGIGNFNAAQVMAYYHMPAHMIYLFLGAIAWTGGSAVKWFYGFVIQESMHFIMEKIKGWFGKFNHSEKQT